MGIKWRLTAVMADREVSIDELIERTGFHRGTISKLRNHPPDRFERETLEKLCKALSCQPGDLMVYIPDEE